MKKGLIPAMVLYSVAVTASLLTGCKERRSESQTMERNDSVTITSPDSAFYGHLGEGTGMSCIELITNENDTMVLNKTNEETGDLGLILGEIANYTDQYAVTTCDSNQSVHIALNISQLIQRKWQTKSDTTLHQGFILQENGQVQSLSDGDVQYEKWGLCNCQLILQQKKGKADQTEVWNDTLKILDLSPDSLVLQSIHTGSIEIFHRLSQ